MVKIQGVALCALMAASGAEARGQRALRQAGGGRILQATQADTNKAFEQMYFSETMGTDSTVLLLESGPFKLEASCKTVVVQNTHPSWYSSSYPTSTYSYSFSDDFYSTWDPQGNYTESFLALDLTYTAPADDYVYGPPAWWYNHPNETLLVGPWEAGDTRTATIFQGYDGSYGMDFTLQSLSGHYISIDGGDTAGIHKAHTEWLPGGMESFPTGIECMVAGFLTYHIPAIHDLE